MDDQTYRAAYEWPNGARGRITFHASPREALTWAGDYVRYFALGGELLSLQEVPSQRPQFQLGRK